MSAAGSPVPGGALELPPFSLDVQALDLGTGVKAVGLELVGTENREPVRGKEAAEIWSAVFPALVAGEPYVVDFFSHIDRVREFCRARGIALREAAERCVVLPQPSPELLRQIFERFEGETFGIRVGVAANEPEGARGPSRIRAPEVRILFGGAPVVVDRVLVFPGGCQILRGSQDVVRLILDEREHAGGDRG